MARTNIYLLFVLLMAELATSFAHAQTPRPRLTAADLMNKYTAATDSIQRHELLISVLNQKLPATPTNLQIVRLNLSKASAVDEKILLIKILASMYTPRARSQANLSIESDIKKLIDSPDRRLGAAAVMEYSRLASPNDRYDVLRRARGAGIIDDDGYFGELAHGLRFSRLTQQLQMLDEIEASRNQYAHEVLASEFSSEGLLGRVDTTAQAKVLQVLLKLEPDFPMALDSFGAFDMTRYVIWMDAVAEIESVLSGKSYAEIVIRRLSGQKVDPRKILAVFSHAEGQRVIRESRDVDRLRKFLVKANAYAYSLPQNTMLNDASRAFTKHMAGK